jgi:hypothetical protein
MTLIERYDCSVILSEAEDLALAGCSGLADCRLIVP